MATIASLVVQIAADTAQLRTDMDKAQGHVATAMQGIGKAVDIAKMALGALGVGVSLSAFISAVDDGIHKLDELHQVAQKTGTTVEQLSALKGVGKLSETGLDQITVGLEKLAKNATAAADGSGKAAAAFADLGVQVADADGKMRPNVDILRDVATQLMANDDGTRRVAEAQQIFGKSGAELLPFLEQLAKTGELHAKVTTAQAEAAHQFEQSMTRLKGGSNALKLEMAQGLLPALNNIASSFLQLKGSGTDTVGFWQTVGLGIQFVAGIAGALVITLIQGVRQLYALGSAAASLAKGDLAGAKQAMSDALAIGDQFKQQFEAMMRLAMNMPQPATPAVAQKRAAGGPVDPKQLYWVGEEGPELFVPNVTGSIVPTDQLTGSGPTVGGLGLSPAGVDLSPSFQAATDSALSLADALETDVNGALVDVASSTATLKGTSVDTFSTMSDQARTAASAASTASDDVRTKMTGAFGDVHDAARAMGSGISGVFSGLMRDGANLGSLLTRLAEQLLQMVAQKYVLQPIESGIESILSGILGGVSGAAARASGGPVTAGVPYTVGEFGRETFVPSQAGTIVPAGAGGASVSVVNHYNIDSRTDQASIRAMLDWNRQQTIVDIHRQFRAGGALRRELQT
jgi:hypothetical protein